MLSRIVLSLAALAPVFPAALASAQETTPCQATEIAKITAADGGSTEYFGSSVALSGSTGMVGSLYNEGSGSVYVFHSAGLSWVEEAKLLPSDGAAFDRFGGSVALSGDAAVIGAYTADLSGHHSGSAYVFRFNGLTWIEEAKLLPDDLVAGDWLGYSVALSGNPPWRIVIGAPRDPFDPDPGHGAAYVFRFDGSSWVQEVKLQAADGAADDKFGVAVAIHGNVAVIGAERHDENGPSSGSAYVFRYDGAKWVQEAKLLAWDGADFNRFGNSVALSGNVAVIGAERHDENGPSSGSAYVFRYDGAKWVQEAKLLAWDGAEHEQFGNSVALSGDIALIAAHHSGGYAGSAYAFHFDGSDWIHAAKLLASDGVEGEWDRFGYSVAISGDTALIGANSDDDHGSQSGSAYVFRGLSDCNDSGTLDLCDITDGTSPDENENGVPDECEFHKLSLDIKPGSDSNPINPSNRGVIPVAILTTEDFDALTVDADSVMFGPDEAEKRHKRAHVLDVDDDGDLDLLLHFRTQDSGIAPGDIEACLIGQTFDGVPLRGCDSVRTVPPN